MLYLYMVAFLSVMDSARPLRTSEGPNVAVLILSTGFRAAASWLVPDRSAVLEDSSTTGLTLEAPSGRLVSVSRD